VAPVPATGRLIAATAVAVVLAAGVARGAPTQEPVPPPAIPVVPDRHSLALGSPTHGRLVHGVEFPVAGPDHLTWDNVDTRVPNRGWRRWGTSELVRTVLTVLHEFRLAHPEAPRVLVGDLSREHGGPFGANFGGLGHFSHQNGRDVDIYYPRIDRLPRAPVRVEQIDHGLAADLVRRFVEAGAVKIYVGPHTALTGPRRIVQKLAHHDNHLHVRIGPVGS
jgi:murein endopeptidase